MRLSTLVTAVAITAAVAVTNTQEVAYAESNSSPGANDPVGAIYAAARNHSVDPDILLRVAKCESQFDRFAIGDHGSSLSVFQLSALPTGLLKHFFLVGYDNPFDSEQQADYVARVVTGEFLPWGSTPAPPHPYGVVSIKRWSCFKG